MKVKLILLVLVCVASTASAAIWTNSTTDQDWATPNNWDSLSVPGAADSAYLVNSTLPAAQISSNVGTVYGVQIGQGGGDGALEVSTGGSLSASFIMNLGTDTGRSGTYTQTGGTVTTQWLNIGKDGAASTMDISGGSFTATGLNAEVGIGATAAGSALTISGDSSFIWDVQLRANNSSSINVVGSNATITGNRVGTTVNGLVFRTGGILDFEFDAAGISTIDISDTRMNVVAGSTLNIDGSSYTGGIGTFTLVDYAVLKDGNMFTTENISGFGALTATTAYADGVGLTLTVVPEPATMILLGLGGLMLRRKRS